MKKLIACSSALAAGYLNINCAVPSSATVGGTIPETVYIPQGTGGSTADSYNTNLDVDAVGKGWTLRLDSEPTNRPSGKGFTKIGNYYYVDADTYSDTFKAGCHYVYMVAFMSDDITSQADLMNLVTVNGAHPTTENSIYDTRMNAGFIIVDIGVLNEDGTFGSDTPATGDPNLPMLYSLLLLSGAAALILLRKKRNA